MGRSTYPHVVGEFRYREQPGKWRFVLEAPLTIRFPLDHFGHHEFYDDRGNNWVTVNGSDWTVESGYAWDGNSPKVYLLGRHWGTPDFVETRPASAWHDSAGQFRQAACIQVNLPGSLWNRRFADIIRGQGAPKVAALYEVGLTIGNPFYQLFGRLGGAKVSGRCNNPHNG